MKCNRCHRQLMAYVQDELGRAEQSAIEQHLGQCEGCGQALAKLRQTLALVDQQDDLEPSAAFEAGFRRKLAATQSKAKRHGWLDWRMPAVAMATAAAALVAIISLKSEAPQGRQANLIGPLAELQMMRHLDLLQNYDVVDNLDGLENLDVVINLDVLEEVE